MGVTLDMDLYRPQELPAWTTLDSHIGWRLNSAWELGLDVRNLLDEEDHVLAKAGPFPYDYKQSDRTLSLYATINL